ncbi:hypothetical protein ACL2XK_10745 [Sodalis sp. RH23]|uniref:hypothetical protein n=1 Tax=unclassified Sodalis (in: enterobacteria) TaxID=2636512 RepID=UPI003965BC88
MLRSLLCCHSPSEPESVAPPGVANAFSSGSCIPGALARGINAVANRCSQALRMAPSLEAAGEARPQGLDTLSMELLTRIGHSLSPGDLLRLSCVNKTLYERLKTQRDSIILTRSLARRCGYPRVKMLMGSDDTPGVLAAFPPHYQLAPVLRIIERVSPPDEAAAEWLYQRLSQIIDAWPDSLQNQGWTALSYYRLRGLSACALADACKDLLRKGPALSTVCREHVGENILYHFRLLRQRDRGEIMLGLLALTVSYRRRTREAILAELSLDVLHLCPGHILPALDALLAAVLTLPLDGRLRIFRELKYQLPHILLPRLNHQVAIRLINAWRCT